MPQDLLDRPLATAPRRHVALAREIAAAQALRREAEQAALRARQEAARGPAAATDPVPVRADFQLD